MFLINHKIYNYYSNNFTSSDVLAGNLRVDHTKHPHGLCCRISVELVDSHTVNAILLIQLW